MVQHDRHDAILVKIIHLEDDGSETMVSSYYTTAISETLKMFIAARDNDISCYFNEYSTEVDKKFIDYPGWLIEDVYLSLGSSDDIPVIEVII